MLSGIFLLLISAAWTYLALRQGGWYTLALWPAASFLVIAVAYFLTDARLLGKRRSGRLHPAAAFFHAPYLLVTWMLWHLVVAIHGTRDSSLVSPGLWLGRRPKVGEIPPGTTLLADMTCEFSVPRRMLNRFEYIALPTLDGSVPPLEDLLNFVRKIAAHEGIVYLHCAQGHGRSAMAAACVLLARGEAADAKSALQKIRDVRPKIQLTHRQKKLLEQAVEALR